MKTQKTSRATGAVSGMAPVTGAGLAHAALALGAFAIGTAEFATMSFLPAFTAAFGANAPAGGHVVSAYALGVVVGAPLLAMAAARMDRRRLLLLLLSWFALGNVLSALATSLDSLLVLRFLTALPHGGYFGVAIVCAVGMAQPERHGAAVARVMMGLALATVTGVPLASFISQWMGWRQGFGAIGMLTLAAAILTGCVLRPQAAAANASAWREIGALRRPQVWLSLAIGAIGFGGLFAVYTYLTSALLALGHATSGVVALILAIFGAGMAAGSFLAPRLARLGTMPAAALFLVCSALALACYPWALPHTWAIGLCVFAIGIGGGLGTILQMRLMEVAGDAQLLAGSLNHAAFNVANALGPWLGGMAIGAGYGWASTGWVGCALALNGLAVWGVAACLARRSHTVGWTSAPR